MIVTGWAITIFGAALWGYGYFAVGHPPLFDWSARTPWWVADFLPNLESEVGLLIACIGTAGIYWPKAQSRP